MAAALPSGERRSGAMSRGVRSAESQTGSSGTGTMNTSPTTSSSSTDPNEERWSCTLASRSQIYEGLCKSNTLHFYLVACLVLIIGTLLCTDLECDTNSETVRTTRSTRHAAQSASRPKRVKMYIATFSSTRPPTPRCSVCTRK